MSDRSAGSIHLCPTCKNDRKFSYAHDAFWCHTCDAWLGPEKCDLKNCIFCSTRGDRPSDNKLCPALDERR